MSKIELYPKNFNLEDNTIWSFPIRGEWATHSGNYRGNWSPYVPRNLILRYTNENDLILDQFVGSGTTLIEAKILNRNAIGVDINSHAIEISKQKLNFTCNSNSTIKLMVGSALDLKNISDNSIDLICTHPPYADIIKYSNGIEGDISQLCMDDFVLAIDKTASEAYRVLKASKMCAIMMGDVRRNGYVIPLGFNIMQCFLSKGFLLKETIIKEQHNCKSTAYWKRQRPNFLLLAHEYIFVFEKK